MVMPVQAVVATICFAVSLPLAISLFPQTSKVWPPCVYFCIIRMNVLIGVIHQCACVVSVHALCVHHNTHKYSCIVLDNVCPHKNYNVITKLHFCETIESEVSFYIVEILPSDFSRYPSQNWNQNWLLWQLVMNSITIKDCRQYFMIMIFNAYPNGFIPNTGSIVINFYNCRSYKLNNYNEYNINIYNYYKAQSIIIIMKVYAYNIIYYIIIVHAYA